MTSPIINPSALRPGGSLQTDEAGIPYRGSIQRTSPYYWPHPEAYVSLDGQKPWRLVEFDRREGWVQCMDLDKNLLPKMYGKVEVTIPQTPSSPLTPIFRVLQ